MYSENDTENLEDNLTDFDKYYMDPDKSFNFEDDVKFRIIKKTLSSSGYESWWKKEKKMNKKKRCRRKKRRSRDIL